MGIRSFEHFLSASVFDQYHVHFSMRKNCIQVDGAVLHIQSPRFFCPIFELGVVNISGYMQAVQHANSLSPQDDNTLLVPSQQDPF